VWLLAATLISGYACAQSTSSQDSETTTHRRTKHKETATETELRELREQMKAQQDEIDALRLQLQERSRQVNDAQQAVTAAQTQATTATTAAQQASEAAAQSSSQTQQLESTVNDLKTTSAGLQETVVKNQADLKKEVESPAAVHYKGITITPVAFFAFEGVWRQHSVNSDINTPFNSIPFNSATEYQSSEMNFSGRQSRIGALFEGNAGNFKLTGYDEMDFLGTGTTSNNNQSNSYVLRQRQIWGKVETKSGFAVTGGQMWSLVTEDKQGTEARTEVLPQTIDPQYMVGFSWTRQPGIRFQQRFGDYKTGAFSLALSLEQAQITGFTAAGSVPTEYFFGGPGQNGGLYNAAGNIGTTGGALTTYANNVAPDIIVKGAFDHSGIHAEIGGLARFLRDYYLPVTGTTGTGSTSAYTYGSTYANHTSPAGGVFGNIRVTPDKYFNVGLQLMAGQGVGRYGSSQLADATLRPDETLEPIRNYHGLFGIETHPAKKLDIFGYYGGEYAQRTVYTVETGGTGAFNGDLIGYGPQNLGDTGCYNAPGAPGTTPSAGSGGSISASGCSSPTRYIQEPMFGFIYRAVNDPRYGRLQYSFTYSYLKRGLWSGVGSSTTPPAPSTNDSMLHWQMRYYIP
jgi:multidrug efflux pump subunit AcrA (membrane-fusion protein)